MENEVLHPLTPRGYCAVFKDRRGGDPGGTRRAGLSKLNSMRPAASLVEERAPEGAPRFERRLV